MHNEIALSSRNKWVWAACWRTNWATTPFVLHPVPGVSLPQTDRSDQCFYLHSGNPKLAFLAFNKCH